MAEPTLDQIAPGGVVQLGSHLDEATFDSLFPAEPAPVITQPVQQAPAQQGQPTQPPTQTQPPAQQPQQNGYFLQGDKSVYKTVDEATRGINEKDALIEQLRQRYALTTGIDPITGKPVVAGNQPQAVVDYDAQPDKYLDDLYTAAKSGGPQAYKDVQQKFIMDSLKPLAPVLQKAARDQAVDNLSAELPNAKQFIGTVPYNKALDSNPELKQAITVCEQDYRFHSRLPGLYKLAYLTAQGMQLPELLKANASQTTQPTQTQATPPRTTVQPPTSSIPQQATRPTFKTIDGIRATIAEMESKGVKLDF